MKWDGDCSSIGSDSRADPNGSARSGSKSLWLLDELRIRDSGMRHMNGNDGKSVRPSAMLCELVLALVLQSPAASARTLGMVADNTTASVTVFDADTDTVLGAVTIPPGVGGVIGDVLMSSDQTRGFVTNANYEVFVIDLTASPPRLALGRNPILISNSGQDLSISPDGNFLVAADTGAPVPISVIDLAAQTEIHTFSIGSSTTAVDVCSDGSVLALSTRDQAVRRLTIDGTGALTNTGDVLAFGLENALNVFCSPDGRSGLVVSGFPTTLTSFTIPKLNPVGRRMIAESFGGTSGVVNFKGNRVFVRRSFEDFGFVDVFGYKAETAVLGRAPLLSIPVSSTYFYAGIDLVALHPYQAKLYVSDRTDHAVKVYDARTGDLLASITDPHIVDPTGVAIATEPCAGAPPYGAIVGTDGPDELRGTSGNDVIFGLAGDDVIDGRGGEDLICGGAGDDLIEGGPGRDRADGGAGNDTVNGGTDDDVLSVADSIPGNDTVDGGAHVEQDRCAADPGDSVRNCGP